MFYEQKHDTVIFPGKIAFVAYDNDEQLKEKTGLVVDKEFYMMVQCVEEYINDGNIEKDVIVVFMKPSEIENYSHGELAHESVHVANRIFEIMGYNPNRDEDEPLAYLVQYITDKLILFVEDVISYMNEDN